MAERNHKIAAYRVRKGYETSILLYGPGVTLGFVLKVIRRCAIFQVALGFAQLPSQFARIPGQRFQPSAKDTVDRSFHRRVPNQMPGYCFYQVS